MLYYETVFPETLQLLRDIQSLPVMAGYPLVGGTALALQVGHRLSIDLDFFGDNTADMTSIETSLSGLGRLIVDNRSANVINARLRDIKVDVVRYRYPLIEPPIRIEGLTLAAVEDIAAMKLAAIVGRGSKKDFIDLFFLLERYSIEELMDFFRRKISDESDLMVARSLTYFEDADVEAMPKMLSSVAWSEVKTRIRKAVKAAWF